jgi:hypothetical protein
MSKTIEIKNIEILTDLMPTLNELKSVKMSGKTVLKVVKSINSIIRDMEVYDNKRKEVLDKYAEKDENGMALTENINNSLSYKFANDETKALAEKEVMEIMEKVVSITIFPVSTKDIEEIKGVTPEVIARLMRWEFIN